MIRYLLSNILILGMLSALGATNSFVGELINHHKEISAGNEHAILAFIDKTQKSIPIIPCPQMIRFQ